MHFHKRKEVGTTSKPAARGEDTQRKKKTRKIGGMKDNKEDKNLMPR
jgi:hypothetical protein